MPRRGQDQASRIEELFARASELEPSQRSDFLDGACADEPELRREVESLLAADEQAGAFLERPPELPPDLKLPGQASSRSLIDERIDNYRVLRPIGDGGMSEVYLAVRADDTYEKQVALKVIRHDLDRGDLLRRFETERQILAGLDHPNIAKLLDGGTTTDGLPYFVMDYIDGEPLDEYCDRNRLTVRRRLELFRDVCSAVQYAHQNLIVHRDIKASNILVTAEGVPKLLDFGIAKLLKPEQFTREVEKTQTWMRPMTPRYASPEQIEGRPITTASDVYSLGVLLYKLLTGHLPYRLHGRPPTELARAVVEEPPERPSTSIARQEADPYTSEVVTPEQVSHLRGAQPQQLRRRLSGDLDNILLMALRKEPERRYASVEQFSADIHRSMEGLPVMAHADSLGYRTAKFVRRNWLGVAVVAAFALLLIGFSISTAMQAKRVAQERDQAQLERDRAERVQTFMQEIFATSDPTRANAEDMTAGEMLDRGAERIERELADEPLVQAALMQSIGRTYRDLGLFDRARPLLERSLATHQARLGPRHLKTAEGLHELGLLFSQTEEYDRAEELLSRSLELRRERLGREHSSHLRLLGGLGRVLKRKGEFARAEALYREAIATRQDTGQEDLELASVKNNLAALLAQTGQPAQAESLLLESLDLRRRLLGQEHPLIAQTLTSLGAALGMQGKYEEAEPYLQGSFDMYRKLLDREHPTLVEAMSNLARLHYRTGDLGAARRLYGEAIAINRRVLGEDSPKLAMLENNLADVLRDDGRFEEAEARYRSALAIRRRSLQPGHPEIGGSLISLGGLLARTGRAVEAEPALRDGLAILRAALPAEHWRIADASSRLGACLGLLDRHDEAEPLLIEGHEALETVRGTDHPTARAARQRTIDYYVSRGRQDKAAALQAR